MTGRPDRHRDERDGTDDRPDDVARAIDRLDERAAAVRDRQVERALAELDALADPDPATRVAIRTVADRLTARLVATPKKALHTAADGTDAEPDESTPGDDAAQIALELFGD